MEDEPPRPLRAESLKRLSKLLLALAWLPLLDNPPVEDIDPFSLA